MKQPTRRAGLLDRIESEHFLPLRDTASADLTSAELVRLTRLKWAGEAESAYGADDGNRWAFARYLRRSGRISETA